MSLGPMQLLVIALLILLLFGRGKISELMGDFGKGIKSFKKGLGEDTENPPQITQTPNSPEKSASPAPAETGNASSGN